jgi:hypothetical protein
VYSRSIVKVKSRGKCKREFIVRKESDIVLEGPLVSLICPSDKTRVKTKAS